jgi:hypothetical protein
MDLDPITPFKKSTVLFNPIWHDGVIWDRSMPTVHFAGQQWTWETKRQAYLDKYKDLVITPRA